MNVFINIPFTLKIFHVKLPAERTGKNNGKTV